MMVRLDKGKEEEGGMAGYGGTSTQTYCNECQPVLLVREQDRHTSFTPKVFQGTNAQEHSREGRETDKCSGLGGSPM